MFYVYVLFSIKDKKLYYGLTKDLKRRYKEHLNGRVSVTKNRRPLLLIYYEAYYNEKDAITRERKIKSGCERERLREIIRYSLEEVLSGGVA